MFTWWAVPRNWEWRHPEQPSSLLASTVVDANCATRGHCWVAAAAQWDIIIARFAAPPAFHLLHCSSVTTARSARSKAAAGAGRTGRLARSSARAPAVPAPGRLPQRNRIAGRRRRWRRRSRRDVVVGTRSSTTDVVARPTSSQGDQRTVPKFRHYIRLSVDHLSLLPVTHSLVPF